jgi:excisionase family DNA binding protein
MAEYLTVKDVAGIMRVDQRTVYRWIALGRLRPVRISRALRFEKSRLISQLEKYEYGGEDKPDPTLG